MRRGGAVVLALVACVLVACVLGACESPRTEVIVVTDTDLRGTGGIDLILAEVTGPDGTVRTSQARVGAGEPPLPRTLGLVYTGGRLGPFTVHLSGNRGGAVRVERTARFTFQRDRTLMLRMDLLARCEGTTCGADQTCGDGGCRSIDVDPSELVSWSGTPAPLDVDAGEPPPPLDAGGLDAGSGLDAGPPPPPPDGGTTGADGCVPTTEVCNDLDDDCNGVVDDGFDLTTDALNCGSCGHACGASTRFCCASTCQHTCP